MAAQQPPVLANNQRLSIEFVVKPTEDLFLEGSLRRLPRVTRGANRFYWVGVDTVCMIFLVIVQVKHTRVKCRRLKRFPASFVITLNTTV